MAKKTLCPSENCPAYPAAMFQAKAMNAMCRAAIRTVRTCCPATSGMTAATATAPAATHRHRRDSRSPLSVTTAACPKSSPCSENSGRRAIKALPTAVERGFIPRRPSLCMVSGYGRDRMATDPAILGRQDAEGAKVERGGLAWRLAVHLFGPGLGAGLAQDPRGLEQQDGDEDGEDDGVAQRGRDEQAGKHLNQ